jgi:DNA-binding protein HU-beta
MHGADRSAEAKHVQCNSQCLLLANGGHKQRSKGALFDPSDWPEPANLIRLMPWRTAHQGAKPMTASTVTTKHLAYALAKQHQLTKKQGREMLEELTGMIRKHLKKGEQVKIAGLGILRVRNRAARVGRNPATGEVIQIQASKKVAFRASLALKMAI